MPNIGDVTSRLQADASGWIAGYRGAANATQDFARAAASATEAAELVGQILPRIASDIGQASAAFKAGAISATDYQTALATARAQLLQIAPAVRGQVPGALDELNGLLVKTSGSAAGLGSAFAGLGNQSGRLVTAMGYMVSQAAGANFVVGRLAGGIAAFGLGNLAAIGVLAGVAALASVWEDATAPMRNADKAADQLIVTLSKQAQQAVPAAIRGGEDFAAVLDRVRDTMEDVAHTATNLKLAHFTTQVFGNATLIGPLAELNYEADAIDQTNKLNEGLQAQTVALRAARGETKTNAELMRELADAQRLAELHVQHMGDSEQTLQLRLRGVSPEIIRQAEAHDRATAAAKKQADAITAVENSVAALAAATEETERKLQSGGLALPGLTAPSTAAAPQTFALGPLPSHASMAQQIADAQFQAEQVGKEINRILNEDTRGAGDSLKETGRHDIEMLINGMVQGTSDFGPLLKKAMLDLISTAITHTIEIALGIASPSKVAMGWGQHVAEGLALGMAHGAPGAQRAATTLATLTFAPNISVGAARDPLSVARDADWQRAFRESALTAGSQGFRFPA